MRVNYIRELNSFYEWLETNPISDSARNLWNVLMHIWNKSGWKPSFTVAISVLCSKTGLSKSSIIRARVVLIESGRIKCDSREGQLSAIYQLIAFHTDTQSGTQSDTKTKNEVLIAVQPDTQSGHKTDIAFHTDTQSGTINKLNNNKLNNEREIQPPPLPLEKRKEKLHQMVFAFADSFDKTTLQEVFEHYSTPNNEKTMLRYELDDFWDTETQLKKWVRREEKFNEKQSLKVNKQIDESDYKLQRKAREAEAAKNGY